MAKRKTSKQKEKPQGKKKKTRGHGGKKNNLPRVFFNSAVRLFFILIWPPISFIFLIYPDVELSN